MMIENANSGQDGENEIAERFPRMDHHRLTWYTAEITITAVDHSKVS